MKRSISAFRNRRAVKTLTRGILCALVAAIIAPVAAKAQTAPKRELRSAWYSTAWAIDYPKNGYASTSAGVTKMKAEADDYLDKAKAAGHNAVFFQVRPMADRMYMTTSWTSSAGKTYTVYEPVSSSLSGTRGTNPYGNFDALQYWVEGAHARGMELHAWVNPYRMNASLSTSYDKNVESWIITWNAGTTAQPNNKKIFNPALEQTNVRIENVCCVLAGAYDIDGIVFDDYFYPENLCSYTDTDAPDYAQYKAYKDAGGTMAVADWRRNNVNTMVDRVYKAIKSIKPWIRFGISPAGVATKGVKTSDGLPSLSKYCSASDWQYASIGSDPIAWMRNKSVDYISPQIYWKMGSSTNPFGKIAEWYGIVAQKFDRHIYSSHSLSFMADTNTPSDWSEIADQVDANRRINLDGAPGSVMYSAINTFKGCQNTVLTRCYSTRSLVPAMTWYSPADPGIIEDLAKNSKNLSWKAKNNMRYVVYAVPKNVSEADALLGANKGLKSEYIVDITYTNSYTLTTAKADADAYWYAVSTLDRYGFEWQYATLGLTPVTTGYESQTEGNNYDNFTEGEKVLSFNNMWIRRSDTNPFEIDAALARDMAVRSGSDQPVNDVIYIISRSEGSSTASTILRRFNALTGEELEPLQVTYDSNFSAAYAPANEILVDDANQLITHPLALANNTFSLAVINPKTGAAKTMFKQAATLRVDHSDIVGKVADGETWYLFTPASTGVVRWTMNGSTVKAQKTFEISLGTAPRIHAISADRAWVNGSGIDQPVLIDFSTGKKVATATTAMTPAAQNATAVQVFEYEGESYFFFQHTYSNHELSTPAAASWSLARGNDFTSGTGGAKLLWTFPQEGIGTLKNAGGDFGSPVAVLHPSSPASAPAAENTEVVSATPVYLYGYSPGNGIAAYSLVKSTVTGVESISADDTDAPAVYYDINGLRVDPAKATPGVYLRKQGNKTTKVVLP